MSEIKCGNCWSFDSFEKQCRYNPPVFIAQHFTYEMENVGASLSEAMAGAWFFPPTDESEWCGKFEMASYALSRIAQQQEHPE
jgi:hypothetical protein